MQRFPEARYTYVLTLLVFQKENDYLHNVSIWENKQTAKAVTRGINGKQKIRLKGLHYLLGTLHRKQSAQGGLSQGWSTCFPSLPDLLRDCISL